jgi:hypothetical protein
MEANNVRTEFYQANNCVVPYCVARSYFVYCELIAIRQLH